ncbi:MAG: PP2C family protein-serine/threonine phosphatase [Planctomycetota bacterium]
MVSPGREDALSGDAIAPAIRGEQVPEETVCVRDPEASGATWLRVSGAPLKDGGGVSLGGVVVLRDVTEAMHAEQLTLRLSEAVRQTADTVFITNRRGRILYVNPAFETTTGYSSEEVLGKTPRILKSGRHDRAYYEQLWSTILGGETHRCTAINRKKSGEIFYAEQTITPMKDAAGRVSHFVSVSKDMTERRRIQEQEMEVRLAATVQRQLYPQTPPRIEGLDVAGAVFPTDVTCGDYFDFIRMQDDLLGIAIGDVMGHGLGSALVMAETCAYVRSFAQVDRDPSEILRKVNRALTNEAEEVVFVTLLLACIERSTQRLVYANAGHAPGYILDASGEVKRELAPTGPALGLAAGSTYGRCEELVLEPGDSGVLLTDGVTESPGPEGALFEAEGALEVVRAHRNESAARIIEHLHASVAASRGGLRQRDDITIVVFKLDPRR